MKNGTFIGVVEDNNDPQKLGRVKARVMNVYDNLDLAAIPWATPWKDLNGNTFNAPDKGKLVIVVFDKGDKNRPEYIYADHYNDNLEKKLKGLSEADYLSMKSLMFDHRTQIYVNESEGLKIDHKYNNVNITANTIDLNLKDNNRSVNIGDAQASQQAILGNHWMDWFDEFVDNLLGSKAGPFLGNLGAPVIPNPAFISCLMKYKALRDPVFLSHHVNIVDNNKATTVSKSKREDNPQIGDGWAHTKKENDVTTKTDENFKPVEGPKKQADETPPPQTATSSSPTTPAGPSASNGQQSTQTGGTNSTPPVTEQVVAPAPPPASSTKSDPLLDKLVNFMKSKKYTIYEETNILNIVAMRGKDDGVVSNKFDDTLYVFLKKDSGNWEMNTYDITTLPGFIPQSTTASEAPRLPKSVPMLMLGQYVDILKFSNYQNDANHKCLEFEKSVVAVNESVDKYVYTSPTAEDRKIYLKRGNHLGSSETVFNFSSDGSQCFKNMSQWGQFMNLCETQNNTKQRFTYTLCRKSEFEKYIPEPEKTNAPLSIPGLPPVAPTTTPTVATVPGPPPAAVQAGTNAANTATNVSGVSSNVTGNVPSVSSGANNTNVVVNPPKPPAGPGASGNSSNSAGFNTGNLLNTAATVAGGVASVGTAFPSIPTSSSAPRAASPPSSTSPATPAKPGYVAVGNQKFINNQYQMTLSIVETPSNTVLFSHTEFDKMKQEAYDRVVAKVVADLQVKNITVKIPSIARFTRIF